MRPSGTAVKADLTTHHGRVVAVPRLSSPASHSGCRARRSTSRAPLKRPCGSRCCLAGRACGLHRVGVAAHCRRSHGCWVVGARGLGSRSADVLRRCSHWALLALPYLPWLPDWLPALRLLAGPGARSSGSSSFGQVAMLSAGRAPRPAPVGRACKWPISSVGRCRAREPRASRQFAAQDWWRAIVAGAAIGTLTWWAAFVLARSRPPRSDGLGLSELPFVLNSRRIDPGGIPRCMAALRRLPGRIQHWQRAFRESCSIRSSASSLCSCSSPRACWTRRLIRRPRRPTAGIALSVAALSLIALGGSSTRGGTNRSCPAACTSAVPLLASPLAWLYARGDDRPCSVGGCTILLLTGLGITSSSWYAPERFHSPRKATVVVSASVDVADMASVAGRAELRGRICPRRFSRRRVACGVRGRGMGALRRQPLWMGRRALRSDPAVVGLSIAVVSAGARTARWTPPALQCQGRVLFPHARDIRSGRPPITVRYDPFSIVQPTISCLSCFVCGSWTAARPAAGAGRLKRKIPPARGRIHGRAQGSELAGTVPSRRGTSNRTRRRAARSLAADGCAGRSRSGDFVSRWTRNSSAFERRGKWSARCEPFSDAREGRSGATTVSSRRRFDLAASYGPATSSFMTRRPIPSGGFWDEGRSTAHMTLMKPTDENNRPALTMHSGRARTS